MSAHLRKNSAKHVRREHTGIRIVAGAMVAAEQRQRTDLVPTTMLEGRVGQFAAERADSGLMRNAPERDDDAQLFHLTDRRSQEIAAGPYFFRCRLVFWRHAAHGIGDPTIDQLE